MQGVTYVWYYSGKTKSAEDRCPEVKRNTNEPHPTAVKKARQNIKGKEKTSKKIDRQQKIEKKKTHTVQRKLTDEVCTDM